MPIERKINEIKANEKIKIISNGYFKYINKINPANEMEIHPTSNVKIIEIGEITSSIDFCNKGKLENNLGKKTNEDSNIRNTSVRLNSLSLFSYSSNIFCLSSGLFSFCLNLSRISGGRLGITLGSRLYQIDFLEYSSIKLDLILNLNLNL